MSAQEQHVATVTHLPTPRETPVEPATPALPTPPRITAADVRDFVVPPDIWSDRRPSLRDIWLYGVYGRWTHADGPVRFAGAIYATVIAFPLHALGYLALWLVERPSRFLVAATVAALLIIRF
jgi:hypothetical protein